MRATESVSFGPITATTAAFELTGGKYGVTYVATWGGGSVTLEVQAADGSTFVTAATAFAANGYTTVDLPAGQFKFAVATATGVYVSITRIPAD